MAAFDIADIDQLSLGNRKVQKDFFMTYHALVRHICYRYSGDNQETEELVNDVFLRIFEKIDTYRGTKNLKSWIGRITSNICIDRYRSNLNNINTVELNDATIHVLEEEEEEENYDFSGIRLAIQKIPQSHRVVFNLYVFEGLNHQEIANRLDIAVGTSKSSLSRAKSFLRKYCIKRKIFAK